MLSAVFMGVESFKKYDEIYSNKVKSDLKKQLVLSDKIINANDLEENKAMLSDVSYVFSSWGMLSLTEQQINKYLPKLKAVFYAAGSVQSFAIPFLNCGVKVFSAWAANAIPVAEYTVAQIVLANKGFYQAINKTKTIGYEKASQYCNTFCGNYSANIGLLGAGMIGKEVIRLLKPYNFNIKVFDPFLSNEKADSLGVSKASLEEIFSSCDVISNHLANNENTVSILHGGLFDKMKSNVTFINTGRGAQVVEADLAKAMRENPAATAILDVTFPEPPIEGHEFYSLENVILTPHIAGSMCNETQRMGEYMYDEFCAFNSGSETKYEVTSEMLKTMA